MAIAIAIERIAQDAVESTLHLDSERRSALVGYTSILSMRIVFSIHMPRCQCLVSLPARAIDWRRGREISSCRPNRLASSFSHSLLRSSMCARGSSDMCVTVAVLPLSASLVCNQRWRWHTINLNAAAWNHSCRCSHYSSCYRYSHFSCCIHTYS